MIRTCYNPDLVHWNRQPSNLGFVLSLNLPSLINNSFYQTVIEFVIGRTKKEARTWSVSQEAGVLELDYGLPSLLDANSGLGAGTA
jgi:hypothetical protein